ncbi:hypothetical protein [Chromobacterium amazonense]|uniref:hypothetical protein n=1 Tax=Chromobacterium amazonense TaxID=1382803 RepID=UPI0031F6E8C8
MLNFDFSRLAAIGLTPLLLQQALVLAGDQDRRLVRVCRVQRDCIWGHDGESEWQAQALPHVHGELAVGDWALCQPRAEGPWRLIDRLGRSINWRALMKKARARSTRPTSTPRCW